MCSPDVFNKYLQDIRSVGKMVDTDYRCVEHCKVLVTKVYIQKVVTQDNSLTEWNALTGGKSNVLGQL